MSKANMFTTVCAVASLALLGTCAYGTVAQRLESNPERQTVAAPPVTAPVTVAPPPVTAPVARPEAPAKKYSAVKPTTLMMQRETPACRDQRLGYAVDNLRITDRQSPFSWDAYLFVRERNRIEPGQCIWMQPGSEWFVQKMDRYQGEHWTWTMLCMAPSEGYDPNNRGKWSNSCYWFVSHIPVSLDPNARYE